MTRASDPKAVEARLRWLAEHWIPPSAPEVRALMEPPPRQETPDRAAQRRLDELHALLELTAALHEATPAREGLPGTLGNKRR